MQDVQKYAIKANMYQIYNAKVYLKCSLPSDSSLYLSLSWTGVKVGKYTFS